MEVSSIEVGPFQANCWLVSNTNTKEALLIDPGDEPDKILDWVRNKGVIIKYMVATHGHLDHVAASKHLSEKLGQKLHIHREDIPILSRLRESRLGLGLPPVDPPQSVNEIEEGFIFSLGDLEFKVIHTPGHTPGSICIYGEGIIFTGDLIFLGSVGRTDLPGGDTDLLKKSLKEKIITLPYSTKIFPGHGPETTVENEVKMNFFLKDL